MILVKHPRLGCRHVPAEEVGALVAAGWTRFPRSRDEKAAGAWPPPAPAPTAPRIPVFTAQPADHGDQRPAKAPQRPAKA